MFKIRVNMSDFLAWAKRQVEQDIRPKLKEVEVKALAAIKDATPVDTGFARSSWGSIQSDGKGNFKLVNSAPYIGVLNAGHSRQAPRRFIESVVTQFGRPVGAIVNYD